MRVKSSARICVVLLKQIAVVLVWVFVGLRKNWIVGSKAIVVCVVCLCCVYNVFTCSVVVDLCAVLV